VLGHVVRPCDRLSEEKALMGRIALS
jgi:hypothetical protein